MVERASIVDSIKELITTYESDLESGVVKYEKKEPAGGKKKGKKGGKGKK